MTALVAVNSQCCKFLILRKTNSEIIQRFNLIMVFVSGILSTRG